MKLCNLERAKFCDIQSFHSGAFLRKSSASSILSVHKTNMSFHFHAWFTFHFSFSVQHPKKKL